MVKNDKIKQACFFVLILIAAFFFVLSILSNTVTKELGRDEHMYCTAGYLTAQGKLIYRDFSYVAQMPYYPLLCAALYKVLNTDWYLLTARLLSALCELIIIICIVGIYRKAFGTSKIFGYLTGIWAVGIYILNEYVDYSAGFAWNHSAVIACVLIAVWLSFQIDYEKFCRLRLFIIGAILTIAVFMRPTSLLIFIAFAFMLLIMARGSIWLKIKYVVPFLAGSVIFSIWPLSVIIRSGQAFWLNVFTIPRLNAQFLYESEMVYNKLGLTLAAILSPGYLILIVIATILTVYYFSEHVRLEKQEKSKIVFSILLVLIFIIIAYIPPTMWPQYIAVPVPFILICFPIPLAGLCKYSSNSNQAFKRLSYVMLGGLFIVLWYSPLHFYVRIADLFHTYSWVPVQIHTISQDISANAEENKLALTLSPLYAIEGGCEIYTELSAGSFAYRIADRLSEQQRQITHTVGPATLGDLLHKQPPGIIICHESMRSLDESIIAQSNLEGAKGRLYGKEGPLVFFKQND